jgi:hypothetical protein
VAKGFEKERQIPARGPVQGSLRTRDGKKCVHGAEGEQFGYGTRNYRYYHQQLIDSSRKIKSEIASTKSDTFCHFLTGF